MPPAFRFKPPSSEQPFSGSDGQMWYTAEILGVPGTVHLRIGRGADDQYLCTGLAIDAPEDSINTSDLKAIHLSTLVSHILATVPPDEDPAWIHINDIDLSAAGGLVIVSPTPTLTKSRPTRGGTGPKDDELRAFAAAYRRALNSSTDRRRPLAAAAKSSNISPATAHRWRTKCQELGLLDQPQK